MIRIYDIATKDLTQILRDRKTFMFLLLMPILFTIFFGLAFSGSGKGPEDSRLPVGYLDLDHGTYSQPLKEMLSGSTVIRLDEDATRSGDRPRPVGGGRKTGCRPHHPCRIQPISPEWNTAQVDLHRRLDPTCQLPPSRAR